VPDGVQLLSDYFFVVFVGFLEKTVRGEEGREREGSKEITIV
jgi:hypothetical protein